MSLRASASAWMRLVSSGSGARPSPSSGLDQLDRDHQAEAAHVADGRVAGLQRAQPGEELLAALARVGDEALVLDDVEGGVGRGTGHDVAAVRAAVGARVASGSSARCRARIPDSGSPDAMPLAMTRMSGSTSQCRTANISPVRPKPVWTSSAISRMPCCRVISRSRGRNPGRRHDVAALAEDRFDDDRRHPVRVDELVEGQVELGLPVAGAGIGGVRTAGSAVAVRVGRVVDGPGQRLERRRGRRPSPWSGPSSGRSGRGTRSGTP